MKHTSLIATICVILYGCSTNNFEIPNSVIDERTQQLNTNFQYQLLKHNNAILDYNLVLKEIDQLELMSIDQRNEFMNKLEWQLQYVFSFDINSDLTNNKIQLIKLLLLDQLLNISNSRTVAFSEIAPVIRIYEENDEEITYDILMHAKDSLFLPSANINLNSNNYELQVIDSTGIARFTIKKEAPNSSHEFSGKILIQTTWGNFDTIPYYYPNQ